MVGVCASAAFFTMGMLGAEREQQVFFANDVEKFAKSFEDAWDDYEVFGLWIHESCRARAANRSYAMESSVDENALELGI